MCLFHIRVKNVSVCVMDNRLGHKIGRRCLDARFLNCPLNKSHKLEERGPNTFQNLSSNVN